MAGDSSLSDADFDSPEEFPSVDNERMGLAPDCFAKVVELVNKGNHAFRENKPDEAIGCYSKALQLKQGDPIILSNRSAAFCRVSRLLRERHAYESDYRPLNGLDPTTHAELALKDAEKVLTFQNNSVKSYFLKANALILLERYDEAWENLISGLQIDPLSSSLQNLLQNLECLSGGSVRKHGKLQRCDDFECTVCFKLLYEPVTTPCGHSFCRACLFQSMDHGNKCPMCRTVLFISPRTYPISVTLNNIIQKNFPDEYEERKAEHDSFTHLGGDIIPLFVMDVVLPCQKLSLNIFEPRYRLMVRRVMEGNHRMGMVVIDPATDSLADFACEVEISDCQPLPDGRFYLEVEGRRRFRILRSWDQDGYHVAEVEWVQDSLPLEGTPEREELQEVASRAAECARTWIQQANEASRFDRRRFWRMEPIQAEGMPSLQDPERFSFWFINLLNLGPTQKLDLLRLRDTRERISRGGLDYQRTEQQGCRVQ